MKTYALFFAIVSSCFLMRIRAQESDVKLEAIRADAVDSLVKPEFENSPRYALIVFGEHAATYRWVVADGDSSLFFDVNGNGNLNDAGEQFDPIDRVSMAAGDGYSHLNKFQLGTIDGHVLDYYVWVRDEFTPVTHDYRKRDLEMRDSNRWLNGTLLRTTNTGLSIQMGTYLCSDPRHAQVNWVGGPLTFLLSPQNEEPIAPGEEFILKVLIGTPGLATQNGNLPVFSHIAPSETLGHGSPIAELQVGDHLETIELNQQSSDGVFIGHASIPSKSDAEQLEIRLANWDLGGRIVSGNSWKIPCNSK